MQFRKIQNIIIIMIIVIVILIIITDHLLGRVFICRSRISRSSSSTFKLGEDYGYYESRNLPEGKIFEHRNDTIEIWI